MRVTFRIHLGWTLLFAFCLAGLVACVAAWFVLLSTICSSPRTPAPQAQVAYSCHGMTVFISPLQDALLHWLTPTGLLFILLGMVAAAKGVQAAARAAPSGGQHAGPRVRIIAVPPGDAPAWVREKWVGLELPLAQSSTAASRARTAGVLSGPRSPWGALVTLLRGGYQQKSGFVIDVTQALSVLELKSPDAAQWWRTHAPHMVKPSRYFLFSEDVCQVVQ